MLHPRLAGILEALDEAQRECQAVVDALTPMQREAPPTVHRWSVAQHLEHLVLVDDGAGRVIGSLIKQVRAAGTQETDTDSVLGSLDRFQIWTVREPVVAPASVQPTGTCSAAESMTRLLAIRARTVAALRDASGLALGSVTFPHPVVGPISAYQWALFLAHHQRRHTAQMRGMTSPLSA